MMSDANQPHRLDQPPDQASRRWDVAFSPARFALLLGIVIAVSFSDVVFGGATFFVRDYARFGYPLALYHQNSFWAGEIPLWNPFNSCGLPFLAQWNTLATYPGSLFYLLLPLSWALGVFNLLHLFFGGMGMYFLGRHCTGWRLAGAVAGLAYAFNGFTLNALMWPNYMASLGWLPWVLLVGDRALARGGRSLFAAGVVCAMQVLAGTPELTAMTWLVLGIFAGAHLIDGRYSAWVLSRRLLAVVGIGLLLSTIQLLPFVELLRHSERGGEFVGNMWSMLPTGWARLVLPSFYGAPTSMGIVMDPAQSFTNSYYPSTLILVLACLSTVRARSSLVAGLIFLSLIILTLALGDAGHLYAFLLKVFPPIGLMRYPVKFVMLLTIVAPLLAAWGMAALASTDGQDRSAWRLRNRILISAGVLLMLTVFLVWFEHSYPVVVGGEFYAISASNGVARAGFLVIGTSLLLWLRGSQLKLRSLAAVLFLGLLWLDLLTHTPRQNPTVARSVYQPGFAALEQLDPKPALGHSRAAVAPAADLRFQLGWIPDSFQNVLLTRLGMTGNANILDNMPKVGGFYALSLRESSEVEQSLWLSLNLCRTNIADFLSVSQVNQLPADSEQESGDGEQAPAKPFEWAARHTFLPFVTAGMMPVRQEPTNVVNFMRSEAFDPRKVVVVSETGRLPAAGSDDAEVFLKSFSAHRVVIEARSSAPTLVVVGQSLYPPWKADVDGQAAPLIRANHAFQAVPVDAGTHVIVLRYADRMFQLGLAISLTVFAGGARLSFQPHPRRQARKSDPW
jgi:hypothetical protein